MSGKTPTRHTLIRYLLDTYREVCRVPGYFAFFRIFIRKNEPINDDLPVCFLGRCKCPGFQPQVLTWGYVDYGVILMPCKGIARNINLLRLAAPLQGAN